MHKNISINHIVNELQDTLPGIMTQIPGCSIAIIKDAQLAWSGGIGIKDAKAKEPVTNNTVFELASLSKPPIAYAALKMCELGLLELDRPLDDYLPSPYVDDPLIKKVTLRHLLSHSSGLPNHFEPTEKKQFHFCPGEQYSYSGEGYIYLSNVIEQLTQTPFASYMKDHILSPLELNNSSYVWLDKYETQAATPHDENGNPTEKWKPEIPIPSYSLHSTVDDFAKLMIQFLDEPHKKKNKMLINNKTKKKMLDPQIKVCDVLSWGLGWGLEHAPHGDFFWHWGDNQYFKSFSLASREMGCGVVAMTNSVYGAHLFSSIVEITLGGYHPTLDQKNWEYI